MGGKTTIFYILIFLLVAIAIAGAIDLFAQNSSYSIIVGLNATGTKNLYPYNVTFFKIHVQNNGRSISDLVVGLYENGSAISVYKISLPSGKNVSISANYTYLSNGTYTFEAIADPAHLFNIPNRKRTISAVTIKVSASEQPNVYTSIPNNNIIETSSFSFSGAGLESISALASTYNLTIFENVFGPLYNVLPIIAYDSSGYVAYANGAVANYSNKTIAYTLWLKGTVNPEFIGNLLSTYGYAHSTISSNGNKIGLWKKSNTTSICVYYQEGWTKIFAYYNNSMPGTCANFSTYIPSESSLLVSALHDNKNLTAYQSRFIYTNSSEVGTILSYSMHGMSAVNIFKNGYGLFAGSISANTTIENNTCYGMLYNQSNTSVCSVYVIPKSGKALPQYGMINSTYASAFPAYVASLYSLTNSSLLMSAHASAVQLLSSLGMPKSIEWVSIFKNTCAFSNNSIRCKVDSFNVSSSKAYLSISNYMGNTIRISSLSCFMAGASALPESIGKDIAPGNSIELNVSCSTYSLPVISTGESFNLLMNYTYMNKTVSSIGIINVTNYRFG